MAFEIPGHLTGESKVLWAKIVADSDPAARKAGMLVLLEGLDRLHEIRGIIKKEGLTVTSSRSKMTRAHPLLRYEVETRKLVIKTWLKLGLHHKPYRSAPQVDDWAKDFPAL